MRVGSEFQPKPAWRWWLHLGANETRLMYPRQRNIGVLVGLSNMIEETFRQIGVALLPAIQNINDAFAQICRYYFGD